MWRGFGAESESQETERRYFRPRISSISGVLAMTKKHLFSPPTTTMKDDIEAHAANQLSHSSGPINYQINSTSINPSVNDSSASDNRINGMCLTGTNTGTTRYVSPSRASYGEIMTFSRANSARASIDSTTAHAVYGTDLSASKFRTFSIYY